MRQIAIHTEYIALGQFLKLADCIDSGGQVKLFLQEHRVIVNGEPEHRRGRKLYAHDVVQVEGMGQFQVIRRGS